MTHIHDKIDFTSEVFIVCKNKVLLRKHDKYKLWLSVGGHIELHEDPVQAAIREVFEEVGLNVQLYKSPDFFDYNGQNYTELIPPIFMNRHKINETHEHVTLTYFAKSDNNQIKQSNNELSEECKWFSKEEIDSNTELSEHIKFYAKKALETLGNN